MATSLSETIRRAMIATGLSDLEISRQTGVTQPQLWKFRHGQADLRSSSIDKLAAWLRVTAKAGKPPKVKPKKRGPRSK
jgi:transcriptional regulator with XRE-family HTH domain